MFVTLVAEPERRSAHRRASAARRCHPACPPALWMPRIEMPAPGNAHCSTASDLEQTSAPSALPPKRPANAQIL